MIPEAEGSSRPPEFGWPLETVVYYAVFLPLYQVCPFRWAIDSELIFKEPKCMDYALVCWVLIWVFLLAALWYFNFTPTSICVVLAIARLVEIYVTGLGTILGQKAQAGARSVVTILVYLVQVVLIFAILGHNLVHDSFIANPDTAHQASASGRADFLYISWSNVTSLGTEYVGQNEFARFLEVLSATTGIFLLSVLLAYGINEIKKPPDRLSLRTGALQ
jgi:hypothetical protein